MKANTVIPNEIPREKTHRTLLHSLKLQERIVSQKREFGGMTIYDFEKERLEKVIRKLAFGHLAYENDTLSWDSTYSFSMGLLPEMSDSQKKTFFQSYTGALLPEVSSHGLEHIVLSYENNDVQYFSSPWISVQEGRYAYCVSPDSNRVKFIIADFLAVEVRIID